MVRLRGIPVSMPMLRIAGQAPSPHDLRRFVPKSRSRVALHPLQPGSKWNGRYRSKWVTAFATARTVFGSVAGRFGVTGFPGEPD